MSYVFRGNHFDYSMDADTWKRVYDFARNHGWDAPGTISNAPTNEGADAKEFDGSYFVQDGRGVDSVDAYGLGRNIMDALTDDPEDSLCGGCKECGALTNDPVARYQMATFAVFCMETDFLIE